MLELANIDKHKVSDVQAYIYMIVMNFVSVIVMLNLFLMVTLQQYDEFTGKTYNPVEVFETFLGEFQLAWNKYANERDDGLRIKLILLPNFFMDFSWKGLNFPEENKIDSIKKYISELNLDPDNDNCVYFHEILFLIVKDKVGSKVDKEDPDNAVIVKEEKKIQKAIKNNIKNYIISHNINPSGKKNPMLRFNPLTSHLYYKISYVYIKNFIKNYQKQIDVSNGEKSYTNDQNTSQRNEFSSGIEHSDSKLKSIYGSKIGNSTSNRDKNDQNNTKVNPP